MDNHGLFKTESGKIGLHPITCKGGRDKMANMRTQELPWLIHDNLSYFNDSLN